MIFSPLGKSWSDIRSGPPMIAPPAQACSSNAETLQRYLAVYGGKIRCTKCIVGNTGIQLGIGTGVT